MSRLDLVRTLLLDCEQDYNTGDKDEDISSAQNTVSTYSLDVGQRKYVHMYFAKSVACWRGLRRDLDPDGGGPVVSIGAGPCTCLMGWFYDHPPEPGQWVRAVDVLDWSAIRDLDSHKALLADILGDVDFKFVGGVYFPPGTPPPQVTSVPGSLGGLPVAALPEGGTVLLPFVLNHLVGRSRPVRDTKIVFDWLDEVRRRSRLVVIVDMPNSQAEDFWRDLGGGLGAAGLARVINADLIDEFAGAYSRKAAWPVRRTSSFMKGNTVLVGDQAGWRFP